MENGEQGPTSGTEAANEMRIEVAAATRTGRRPTNADAFLIDDAAELYAVADGMGDLPASGLVARPVAERPLVEAQARMVEGICQADWRVCAPYLPMKRRIGTTFAGVVLCGDAICAAHVGDSRAYLLQRRGAHVDLAQLTEDHTALEEAILRGVPRDVAIAHPDAHKLTRVLGVHPGVEVAPIVRSWEPGDVALLCTDGVSDRVDVGAMAAILLDASAMSDAARRIVDRADEAGGFDNATVVLLRRVS